MTLPLVIIGGCVVIAALLYYWAIRPGWRNVVADWRDYNNQTMDEPTEHPLPVLEPATVKVLDGPGVVLGFAVIVAGAIWIGGGA